MIYHQILHLTNTTSEEFIFIFNSIPKGVTHLDLRYNALAYRTNHELAAAFAAIEDSVTYLDLSENSILSNRAGAELALFFSFIPTNITHLNLQWNGLYQQTGTELALAFAGLPIGLAYLDLSNNFLGYMSSASLGEAFAAIPVGITHLNLSNSKLHLLTVTDLVQALQAIPSTVTCIDLSYNELFLNKTYAERDAILNALKPLEQNGRLLLSHNGEPSFARALLPLMSAIKQEIVSFDVASEILSFLLPEQAHLPSRSIIRNKIIKSVTANEGELLYASYRRHGGSFFKSISSPIEQLNNQINEKLTEAEVASLTLNYFCL
ncbi:leucine-rich repeat-containing protein (substrate of the Dot/Icm secretion system) [Legionella sainthelensi]|uniref:hypothetical protein n=1 Tax=Legionella sainthelensi TaxID=28087 RepID=UPI000F7187C2|nr:hypothetical protein [Legionella sainthelensi]VEB35755.1 leucine-rich repeat-containing protein (substrate of the Dot/Icm secretion system) [Legionella sainthelensi]